MNTNDAYGIAYQNGYNDGRTDGEQECMKKICFCCECENIVGTFQTDESCYCRFVRGMVEPGDYCSWGKKVV